ncbi:DUF6221 family protein [Streptomyces sp. NPDC012794]|uniref:DUF6221 family protein n=1 Tax=Streptomyces sp. NPDC012794 TaxID=3364850 RepID=UPI0036A2ABD9
MDDLLRFLRSRLDDDRLNAHSIAGALARNADSLDLHPGRAAAHAQERVTAAQARIRLLEETIVPYLWVDGRAGRLAELQLRLMAFEFTAHRDYRTEWAPDSANPV